MSIIALHFKKESDQIFYFQLYMINKSQLLPLPGALATDMKTNI